MVDVARGTDDARRHGVGVGSGISDGMHAANMFGTTTNASTSNTAIQTPRKMPVARAGSGDPSRSGSCRLNGPRLPAQRDALDLHASAGPRKLRDLDGGARRPVRPELLGVDLVHRGELGHVREEH